MAVHAALTSPEFMSTVKGRARLGVQVRFGRMYVCMSVCPCVLFCMCMCACVSGQRLNCFRLGSVGTT